MAPKKEQYGWEAEWKFLPTVSHGAFDVAVKLKPGNSYPPLAENRKRVPVPGVYHYDGSTYRHAAKNVPLNEQ
jgi:hypothetical protein